LTHDAVRLLEAWRDQHLPVVSAAVHELRRIAQPFEAIIAARLLGDADLAAVEVEACLANDPPAELRGLIEELVTPAR
jgi:hypothetical protein